MAVVQGIAIHNNATNIGAYEVKEHNIIIVKTYSVHIPDITIIQVILIALSDEVNSDYSN